MGLFKKGKIWWFIKQYRGHRVEQSLGTENKKLAERLYAETLPKIIDGSYFEEKKRIPMIKEVIQRYMTDVSPIQKSHSRNLEIAAYWNDFFKDCLVSDVTTSFLSSYKAKRLTGEIVRGKGKGRKAGQSTVKKELAFLRAVFNTAIDEWEDDWDEYFKGHPLNPVKKVIKGLKDNKRIRYVTPDEAQKLRFTLPEWIKPMVIVACHTGLREGNIVNLTVSQVDFHSDRINIRSEEMKDGDPLSIKMTAEVRDTLSTVIKKRKVLSSYVFCDDQGKPYDTKAVSMAFLRACRAGFIENLRFHDLRHDFATLLINNGATLFQVQANLGHSDPRMTQRYAHLLPENQNVVNFIEGKGTTTILRQS
ncbi:MAG: site-specific integrase [Dissulfurispiraceae bacterium]